VESNINLSLQLSSDVTLSGIGAVTIEACQPRVDATITPRLSHGSVFHNVTTSFTMKLKFPNNGFFGLLGFNLSAKIQSLQC
jgi:hypothetical protein